MKSSSATGTTIAEAPFASPVAAGEVDRRSGESSGYVGRFAPSPSGPLHFGSLVAALGSWLDARAHRGRWLVRIEDIDPPREKPGAADAILRTLETLGLDWDGEVLRQSTRTAAYAAALARLSRQNLLHACQCTRAALTQLPQNRDRAPGSNDELFHPRRCPTAAPGAVAGQAWRLRVPDGRVAFTDRSLGEQDSDVAASVGNFVLRRRDGLFAYQLAVVVDDAYQGITDVVRGCDLLASTPRQVLLQQALGLPRVRYLHLPLAVDRRGRKLSKSEDAPAADRSTPAAQLVAALEFLGQHPPAALGNATPRDVLEWAREHWGVQGFAGRVSGAAPQGADAGNAGEERA